MNNPLVPKLDESLKISVRRNQIYGLIAFICFFVCFTLQALDADQPSGDECDCDMVLENRAGLKWSLFKTAHGWALGTLSLHGKPIEKTGSKGLMFLYKRSSGDVLWLAAAHGERVDSRTATERGQSGVFTLTQRFARFGPCPARCASNIPARSITS